jgi:hypothetical protein
VLKLTGPLPLKEHRKVQAAIRTEPTRAERTTGLLRWTGKPDDLRRIAEEDEFGVMGAR